MTKISIIIPVYNAEKTLERCLKSVAEQMYTNFEVVLVNDGSKDGSKDICDRISLNDKKFRTIHVPNGGVSKARNIGLAESCGEHVTFVDADDEIIPNYLSLLLKGGNVDFSLCGYKSIYLDGRTVIETLDSNPNEQLKETISGVINHRLVRTAWGKLFKKSLIVDHKLEFDTSIKLAEDTLFVLQYIRHINSIFISAEIGYLYYRPAVVVNRHNSSPEELLDIYAKFLKTENSLIRNGYHIADLKYANLQTIYFYYFNLLYSSGRFNSGERSYYYQKIINIDGQKELFFLSNRINRIFIKPLIMFNNFLPLDCFLRLYFYLLSKKVERN